MTKRKSDFTLPTNSLDELFSSQEERVHPFKAHPFKIQNDDEMKRLVESIQNSARSRRRSPALCQRAGTS